MFEDENGRQTARWVKSNPTKTSANKVVETRKAILDFVMMNVQICAFSLPELMKEAANHLGGQRIPMSRVSSNKLIKELMVSKPNFRVILEIFVDVVNLSLSKLVEMIHEADEEVAQRITKIQTFLHKVQRDLYEVIFIIGQYINDDNVPPQQLLFFMDESAKQAIKAKQPWASVMPDPALQRCFRDVRFLDTFLEQSFAGYKGSWANNKYKRGGRGRGRGRGASRGNGRNRGSHYNSNSRGNRFGNGRGTRSSGPKHGGNKKAEDDRTLSHFAVTKRKLKAVMKGAGKCPDDVCKFWNVGQCEPRDGTTCDFRHDCAICEVSTHKAVNCPNRRSDGNDG